MRMAELGFFYGTLMSGFERRTRLGLDAELTYRGRGWIHASLYDLGLYPAAVPDEDSRVWGEVFELKDPAAVLEAIDEIEGYSVDHPDTSLYVRRHVPVHLVVNRASSVRSRRAELASELLASGRAASLTFIPHDPRVEDAVWDAGIPERGAFARAAADLLERVGCST